MRALRKICLLLVFMVLLACVPAYADEAGVLTETELGQWLNSLLTNTANVQPQNAPVGEAALTVDGYAFLYDDATLYYNKPVLDAQSVLNAVSVTNESFLTPRGIHLGSPASALMAAFGWQNPTLTGDDTFAVLYVLNQLPNNVYWAMAQRSDGELQSIQCAIHALAGEDRYTDSGVMYNLQNGEVTGIRVYGLSDFTTRAGVESNLVALGSSTTDVTGITQQSDAEPFGQSDFQFGRMDFLTLTEKGAGVLFGQPVSDAWVQDDNGWLHTINYPTVSLVFGADAQKRSEALESITVTGDWLYGPRGLATGLELSDVLGLFRADGTGKTNGAAAILYGDGQNPPYGTLETNGSDATLRYAAQGTGIKGQPITVALRLAFTDGRLTEWMLYTL